jgi:hypothetical protein
MYIPSTPTELWYRVISIPVSNSASQSGISGIYRDISYYYSEHPAKKTRIVSLNKSFEISCTDFTLQTEQADSSGKALELVS